MHIFGVSLSDYISYNPHTVEGTWMIIGTVIMAVFVLLFSLRVLTPVKAKPLSSDDELTELAAAMSGAPEPTTSILVEA